MKVAEKKGRKKRESDNKQASEIGHDTRNRIFYSSSDEAKQRSVLSPHSASGEIINSGFILCSGEESSIIFRVERYCESQIRIIKRAQTAYYLPIPFDMFGCVLRRPFPQKNNTREGLCWRSNYSQNEKLPRHATWIMTVFSFRLN